MAAKRSTPKSDGRSARAMEASSLPKALTPFQPGALAHFGSDYQTEIDEQTISTPAGGLPRVKANNGVVYYPGDPQGVESIDLVILCALRRNAYWKGKYVQGSADPPVCGAIAGLGQPESAMAPDPDWPEVQSATCLSCPQNVTPSKTCRNGIEVAVIHADEAVSPEKAAKATIAALSISSSGIAPFGTALKEVAKAGAPTFGTVFRVSSTKLKADNTYYTTVCDPIAFTSKEVADVLKGRRIGASEILIGANKPLPSVAAAEAAVNEAPVPAPRVRKKSAPARRSL